MAVEIRRELIEYLLLGTGDNRRYIQDSPILIDVWARFARCPNDPADLLITSDMSSTANDLAAEVYDNVKRPEGADNDPAVAPLQSLVAAKLYFAEMLTILIPWTSWWQDDRTQAEIKAYLEPGESRLDQVIAEMPELLADWMAGKTSPQENRRTPVERFVALTTLVSFIGVAAMFRKETPEDVCALAKEYADPLGDTVRGVLHRMSPKDSAMVWRISLNRPVKPADVQSVATVKADAARSVFNIDCSKVNWAVLDIGIDGTHDAFAKGVAYTYDFTGYRGIVSLGNDKPDVRKNNLSLIREARGGTLPKGADGKLKKIATTLRDKRPMPWDLIAEFVEVLNPPKPTSDHGTHVAGILGGTHTSDPRSADGMCPDIGLYDFRIFRSEVITEDDLADTEFVIIAALQFIRFLNEQAGRFRVNGVNMSLSIPHDVRNFPCGHTPICKESERLIDSGVVVVAAAGNRGSSEPVVGELFVDYKAASITDPGNSERVITVGSTHQSAPFTYGVSYFSSRGPTGDGRMKPDLVAPGQEITGPLPGNEWGSRDGTSMAAPHVSGAAAMLMARYTELVGNPDRIKKILCSTASDLGRERCFQGNGLLDVLRALQSL